MFEKIIQLFTKPLFWSAFAAISATTINICLYFLNRSTFKILYEKPNLKILHSSATPPTFPSKIELAISNPSNFENTVCSFKLFSLRSFRLIKLVVEKEIDVRLPANSKTNTDIPLNFDDVKNLRGRQAILCLADLKGSKIKEKFTFMPSFDRKRYTKNIKHIRKNL